LPVAIALHSAALDPHLVISSARLFGLSMSPKRDMTQRPYTSRAAAKPTIRRCYTVYRDLVSTQKKLSESVSSRISRGIDIRSTEDRSRVGASAASKVSAKANDSPAVDDLVRRFAL
jgi:hypothetical protein